MATPAEYEYIIVGSGAGGGTLAARLAEGGRTVLLLEAGGDPRKLAGGSPEAPDNNRLPDDYDVPVFHPFASENEAIKWDFFVRHYGSDAVQKRDPKFVTSADGHSPEGILYPRAGTLGGCTAHNALILVYPHNADWDGIADLTGDASWRAENMRRYFMRLENCRHRWPWRLLSKLGIDSTRHGWKGWLHTETSIPTAALGDRKLVDVIEKSARAAFAGTARPLERLRLLSEGFGDPNDWRLVRESAEGICYTPMTTRNHRRMGTRERLLETVEKFPNRLTIELDALATRVLLDGRSRAVGVEYLKGERLYRAHSRPSEAPGARREARASREVILAGGAFNTPQLLMLSGIGPRETLMRNGIDVRVDLPGVGRNLQDRYEIGVVNRMNFSCWRVLEGARFAPGDPPYREWACGRAGMYATNGAGLAVIARSAAERSLPDLFCMAFLGVFKGYFPNYSALLPQHPNYLSWCILKAHTNNRGGEVTLRSADPRDPPLINFRYFDEGDDLAGEDLDSVVSGIRFVRGMTEALKADGLIAAEELPGEHVRSDAELRDYVRSNSWGHHASCTCPIGPREAGAVVDGHFRVYGTHGLRVVDASVFPRIPGFFIASAIYMIAEKAADVILWDAASGPS